MKKNLWMGMMVVAGLLLGACNDDDEGGSGTPATQADIQGKWYLRNLAGKGDASFKAPPFLDTAFNFDTASSYTGSDFYAEFTSDNKYTMRFPNFDPTGFSDMVPDGGDDSIETETGTYTLASGNLRTISSDGDTVNLKAAVNGANLVLDYAIDTAFSETEGTITFTGDIDADIKATLSK